MKDTLPSLVWRKGHFVLDILPVLQDWESPRLLVCMAEPYNSRGMELKIYGAQNVAQVPPLGETLVGRRLLRQGSRNGEGEQTFCSAGQLRATPWSQPALLSRKLDSDSRSLGSLLRQVSLGALSTHSLKKEKESF